MSENAVLENRVSNLEHVVSEVSTAVKSIDDSLKTLTRLDIKHDNTAEGLGRAFIMLTDHETRLRSIESEMPTLKLAKGWIIGGVIGMVTLLFLELIRFFFAR